MQQRRSQEKQRHAPDDDCQRPTVACDGGSPSERHRDAADGQNESSGKLLDPDTRTHVIATHYNRAHDQGRQWSERDYNCANRKRHELCLLTSEKVSRPV